MGGVSGIMGGALTKWRKNTSLYLTVVLILILIEEDHEIHNDSATSSSLISILERLKNPTPSDFAKKEKGS